MRKIMKKRKMKQNYILFLMLIGVFSVLLSWITLPNRAYEQDKKHETNFYIKSKEPKGVYTYTIDEYITGMMLAMYETKEESHIEAYKAFAVVCRTLLWQEWEKQERKKCIEISNVPHITFEEYHRMEKLQANEKRIQMICEAVDETSFIVLDAKEEVAYCSLSNGRIRNVSSQMYIECDTDRKNKNYYHEKNILQTEITKRLSKESDVEKWIIQRDEANYVEKVIVEDGTVYEESYIRSLFDLCSDDWGLRKEGKNVVFTTRGLGHGYGMSLSYAEELAEQDKNYEQILKNFFPNNHLERRYSSE